MSQNMAVVCGAVGLVVSMMAGMTLAQGGKASAEKAKLHPNDAVWALKLSGVYEDKPLAVYLATSGGKVVRAFGLGFNKAIHDFDGSALAIAEASVKGSAKVTINADQWVPAGGKPIECQFDFNLIVKDGKVGGTYQGKRGAEGVSGMVLGTIQAPATEIRGATIKMEMEKALEGSPSSQRVYMTVKMTGGKVGEVQAAARDRAQFQARVKDSTKLAVTPEAVTGDVTIEVYESKAVTNGIYTFTFDGKVIGSSVAGRFTSKLGEKEVRGSAMFTGSL